MVYSSDHGEMLGDHGRWGKSIAYQPSVGVPLVLAGPGVQAGVASDALVSMHDLTATFLDFAGRPPLPGMDSRSLRPLLSGAAQRHRPHVRSGLGDWRMVSDGRYKLVRQTPRARRHAWRRAVDAPVRPAGRSLGDARPRRPTAGRGGPPGPLLAPGT